TPAPQAAPRRSRTTTTRATQRTSRGDDRPGHRAPARPSTAPAVADGVGELRRLADQATRTRDAITTPSFDALLDSVTTTTPPSPVSAWPMGRCDGSPSPARAHSPTDRPGTR